MLLKEYKTFGKDEIYLTEGVRFFKNSKRLDRLADKLEKKISIFTREEERAEIMKISKKVRQISQEFRNIEEKYADLDNKDKKERLRGQYKSVENKYKELVRIINEETIINYSGAAAITGILATILLVSYNFFFSSGFSGDVVTLSTNNPDGRSVFDSVGKLMSKEEADKMKQASDLRRMGATSMVKGAKDVDKYLKRGTGFQDLVSDVGAKANEYLQAEKTVSSAMSGLSTATAAVVSGIFVKVFGKFRRNYLYDRTALALKKLS